MVICWDDVDEQDVLGLGVHARDFHLVAGEHPPEGVKVEAAQWEKQQSRGKSGRRALLAKGHDPLLPCPYCPTGQNCPNYTRPPTSCQSTPRKAAYTLFKSPSAGIPHDWDPVAVNRSRQHRDPVWDSEGHFSSILAALNCPQSLASLQSAEVHRALVQLSWTPLSAAPIGNDAFLIGKRTWGKPC